MVGAVYRSAPDMSQPFRVRLARRDFVADGVADLSFDLVDPPALPFQAGQFVTVPVGRDTRGHPLRRSYSIASRSDQPERLRLIVRSVPGGAASDFFFALAPGAEVEMTGPHGFFMLDAQHTGDVVFAATGTGLAPVLPMLGELERRPEPGRRFVLWGARKQSDLFLVDEVAASCAAAGATLEIFLSQPTPSPAWTGARGRITPAVLERLPTWRTPTFYVVGNGAMIDEVKKGLVALGVERKKHIRTEAFFD